jgi:hypothetical protein
MKSCSFLATALWRSDARLLFPTLFCDGVSFGSQSGMAGGENGRCRCPELRLIGIPGADMNACFDVRFDVRGQVGARVSRLFSEWAGCFSGAWWCIREWRCTPKGRGMATQVSGRFARCFLEWHRTSSEPERAAAGHVGGSNLTPAHAPRNQNGRRQGTLLLKEPLKKDLSLSLGLGRIRLCEALCRADGVLFQGILELYRVSY